MTIQYTVGSVVQWTVIQGDSETFSVTWKAGATPVDLTGYTGQLLDSSFNAIPATVTIPVPANGEVLVSFSGSQTLVMEDQYYRLRVKSGAFQKTLLEGRIDVRGPGV